MLKKPVSEKKKFLWISIVFAFLDATIHHVKKLCPSDRPSVRPNVPCCFRTTIMDVFEGKKSLYDFVINNTMSEDDLILVSLSADLI